MAMGDHPQFADFNLDQLLPAALPTFRHGQACQPVCITQFSAKRSRLAERIAQSDELVRQVKHLQSYRQQLAELQRTAQEVTDLYQREKQQRLELEQQSKQFSERCRELEKELDAQLLNCERLQEELTTRGLPVNAKDVVEVFMQLAQRAGDDIGLIRREQNMIRKLKEYCKTAKINMPTTKSPNPNAGSCRRKTVDTSKATQTNEVVISKRPDTFSTGVQVALCKEMRDQGTQHKNTTTTRGTTTASFIKYQDVGTCFPEPKPMPNARQILDEMLSWHDAQTIEPLSPISDTLLQETPFAVITSSVGTCTRLCNVQREVDFVSIIQPTQIKVSNSRPPSRAMFDSVKDEANSATHYAREMLSFLPRPELASCLSNVPAQAFEELWQVFGQMVLGLLQRRSNTMQTAPPNVSQADFADWLHTLYEGTQLQEQEIPKHIGKAPQDRRCDASHSSVDAGMATKPILDPQVDLRPILLPAKKEHREKGTRKRRRKGGPSWRANSKTSRRMKEELEANEMLCDSKEKVELFSARDHFETEQSEQGSVFDLAKFCNEGTAPNPIEKSQYEYDAKTLHVAKSPTNSAEKVQTKPIEQPDEFFAVNQIRLDQANSGKNSTFEETLPDSKKEQRIFAEPSVLVLDYADSCSKKLEECHHTQNSMEKSSTEQLPQAESAIQFLSNLSAFNVANCDNLELELDEDEIRLLELSRQPAKNSPWKTNYKMKENFDAKILPQITDVTQYNQNLEVSLFGSDSEAEETPLEQKVDIADAVSEDDISSEPGSLIIDEDERSLTPITSPLPPKRKRNSSKSESSPVGEIRLTRQRAKLLLMEEQTRPEEQQQIKEMSKEETKKTKPEKTNPFLEESPASPISTLAIEEERVPVEIPLERSANLNREPTALIKHVIAITKAEARNHKKQKNCKPLVLDALRPKIFEYLKHGSDMMSTCRDFCHSLRKVAKDEAIVIDALINAFSQMNQADHNPNQIERLVKALHYMSTIFSKSIIQNFMNALEMRLFRSAKEKPSANIAQKFVQVYVKLIQLQSSLAEKFYGNPARLLLVKILYHYERDMAVLVLEVLTEYPTVLPHREERSYGNSDPIITVIKHLLMNRKYDMNDPQSAERCLLSKLRFEYHFQPFEPTRLQVIENLVEKIKVGKLQQDFCYAFALFCRRSYSHPLQIVKEVLANYLVPLASNYCELSTQCEDYDERLQTLLQCISMIVRELPLDTDISGYVVLFRRLLMATPRAGVQEAAVQAILRLQKFGFKYALDTLQNYRPNYMPSPLTRAMIRSFAVRREKYQRPQGRKEEKEGKIYR